MERARPRRPSCSQRRCGPSGTRWWSQGAHRRPAWAPDPGSCPRRAPSSRPKRSSQYFIDDRRDHVRECIAPALERGEVVITDRYYLSNVAYQGARGLAPDEILERNEALFPEPAAILLIEVSPEEGLRRVRARGGPLNRSFERVDFLTRAAGVFERVDRPYVRRIAGEATPEQVHERVCTALGDLFAFGRGGASHA